ncbi:hypothetical protein [Streptomonospora salina]|uniref:Uncharacterized protein n=1 Tax=Streptomonospora salina TaxID=104205 RepID=A0A841EB86_9ACTN|nr:hypothetical protein [Streptomonospora salina]MBB6001327.1 hypothetical protein [Streptomonospora salina]
MSADDTVYTYIPEGTGRVEVPGGLIEDYGDTWDIRCYLWTGSEYYYLARQQPAPTAARDYGVRDGRRGPASADTIRQWLDDQAEYMAAYEADRP